MDTQTLNANANDDSYSSITPRIKCNLSFKKAIYTSYNFAPVKKPDEITCDTKCKQENKTPLKDGRKKDSWKLQDRGTAPMTNSELSDDDNDYIFAPRLSDSITLKKKDDKLNTEYSENQKKNNDLISPTRLPISQVFQNYDPNIRTNDVAELTKKFLNKDMKLNSEIEDNFDYISPNTNTNDYYRAYYDTDFISKTKNESDFDNRKSEKKKLHVRLIQIQKLKLKSDRSKNLSVTFSPNSSIEVDKQRKSKEKVRRLLELQNESKDPKIIYKNTRLSVTKNKNFIVTKTKDFRVKGQRIGVLPQSDSQQKLDIESFEVDQNKKILQRIRKRTKMMDRYIVLKDMWSSNQNVLGYTKASFPKVLNNIKRPFV